jgi:Ca-activated chloride channel family protein
MRFITAMLLLLCTSLIISEYTLSAQTRPQPQTQSPPAAGENIVEVGEEEDDDVVRVTTDLITVPVSVVDREGRYVTNLRQESFRIYEDGVEQQIAFFNSIDQPIFVTLLIDTSGSTAPNLGAMKEAAIAFVSQLRPQDTVLPITFDSQIRLPLRRSTSDQRLLIETIKEIQPAAGVLSGTGLYDAVDFVNKHVFKPNTRNALILFTDGGDTGSKATQKDTLYSVAEINALVYSIYYDPLDLGPTAKLYKVPPPDKNYIRKLAEKTGGRFYEPKSAEKINRTMTAIAEELRRQYSLGYYPKAKAQVKQQRSIKVTVDLPKVAVRARDSYIYNPADKH